MKISKGVFILSELDLLKMMHKAYTQGRDKYIFDAQPIIDEVIQ